MPPSQGGMKAQRRQQLEAIAAREHDAEKQRLTKTIREMAKLLPAGERGQYLKVAKDVEKAGAKGNGGSVELETGLLVLTPQAGVQAIAAPAPPLVARTVPAQAVVVAAPQVGAVGKRPKATQSFYVLLQFAVGNNVSMYDAVTGPRTCQALRICEH